VSNHRDDEKRSKPPAQRGEERREGFAEALARSEFGRFYWNESLERRLNEAMRRRPPRQKPRK
jgi:hypothetical protein